MEKAALGICLLSQIGLAACAVQQTNHVLQPANTRLVASVGDTVMRISSEKNLPNIVGGADIFGRKTPAGFIIVRYLGVNDGRAIFGRHGMSIETGATTMNSSPAFVPIFNSSGMSGGVVIPRQAPQGHAMDEGELALAVDIQKGQRELIVEGKTIKIESADNSKLVYSISE
jgi:hypothetical protein